MTRRSITHSCLAAMMLTVAACALDARDSKSTEDQSAPALLDQKFLCEQSYTNFAEGYQHSGTYVDRDGHVYRYKAERQVAPRNENAITEEELEAKYAQGRTLVRAVPPDEIGRIRQLILNASKSGYSEKVQRGADAGAIVSSCYLYDPAKETYREIELDVRGDWAYRNVSPAAKHLTDWLTALSKP